MYVPHYPILVLNWEFLLLDKLREQREIHLRTLMHENGYFDNFTTQIIQ